MSPTIRFVVFHQNCLFREALARVLAQKSGREVEAIDHANLHDPLKLLSSSIDLVLVDLNLPDDLAVRLTQHARELNLKTKVLILVPDDHEKLAECIAAGAQGCVLERSSLKELESAIEMVLNGQAYCSADIMQSMFSQLSKLARESQKTKPVQSDRLTARETEVLELMSQRLSNKQIARRLSVSLYTVKNHVHNILEKLQVETRFDAVDTAQEGRRLSRF